MRFCFLLVFFKRVRVWWIVYVSSGSATFVWHVSAPTVATDVVFSLLASCRFPFVLKWFSAVAASPGRASRCLARGCHVLSDVSPRLASFVFLWFLLRAAALATLPRVVFYAASPPRLVVSRCFRLFSFCFSFVFWLRLCVRMVTLPRAVCLYPSSLHFVWVRVKPEPRPEIEHQS